MLRILKTRFGEIRKYSEMLKSLTRKELRTRYKGSFFGFLWTFINPMLQVAVYSIIFPLLLRNTSENYAMFLFVAQVPWNFFTSTLLGSCGLFIYNSNLVTKVYFPREVLPLSNALGGLCNLFFGYIIVILLSIAFGIRLTWNLLWLPFLFVIQTILCMGIALVFSSVNVYFRDVEHFSSIVIMALYFATPIMYDLTSMPQKMQTVLSLNPMAGLITAYRDVTYYGRGVDFSTLAYPIIFSIVLFACGMCIFDRLQKGFTEIL